MEQERFLCIGAAHWDVIARAEAPLGLGDDAPGVVRRLLGGVACNIALGLAQRGAQVGLCSVIGDDPEGRLLRERLAALGVDVSCLIDRPGLATGSYVAIEHPEGLVAAIADTGALDEGAELVVARVANLLVSSPPTVLVVEANLPGEALQHIARLGRAAGCHLLANPVSPAKAARLIALLDADLSPTIAANLAEANVLTGSENIDSLSAAQRLVRRGAGAALVTDGPRRAALADRSGAIQAKPPAINAQRVTGAGDALLAAYLAFEHRATQLETALDAALRAAADHMEHAE